MTARRRLATALDATLLRLLARAAFALARGWLHASWRLRAAGLLSHERFWSELARSARINRLTVRALAIWLSLARD